MIYFKFPFDKQLYSITSTIENPDINAVAFRSFDQLEEINFKGNIIAIDDEDFIFEHRTSSILPNDSTGYKKETHSDYLKKLEEVIKIIKDNNLPKLVLSRRKIIDDIGIINTKASFENLCNNYPNAFKYVFFDGKIAWIGAFSEVLGKFNKSTFEFETMSIAGTIPVNEVWSEKEIEEQKPVSSFIRNILKKYNVDEDINESETYDHISGNIKHLKTDFNITINPQDLDSIIKELHPTPAVCGIPKLFCIEKIIKIEKYPRELYAGYIKIETEKHIHYYVNLRCARLFKNSAHVFVGGGITAQSNPEKEWQETEMKSEAIIKNLVKYQSV